jgi:hypothetical protein
MSWILRRLCVGEVVVVVVVVVVWESCWRRWGRRVLGRWLEVVVMWDVREVREGLAWFEWVDVVGHDMPVLAGWTRVGVDRQEGAGHHREHPQNITAVTHPHHRHGSKISRSVTTTTHSSIFIIIRCQTITHTSYPPATMSTFFHISSRPSSKTSTYHWYSPRVQYLTNIDAEVIAIAIVIVIAIVHRHCTYIHVKVFQRRRLTSSLPTQATRCVSTSQHKFKDLAGKKGGAVRSG